MITEVQFEIELKRHYVSNFRGQNATISTQHDIDSSSVYVIVLIVPHLIACMNCTDIWYVPPM